MNDRTSLRLCSKYRAFMIKLSILHDRINKISVFMSYTFLIQSRLISSKKEEINCDSSVSVAIIATAIIIVNNIKKC